MNLREALILQAPSLALLRAAADEIARQDGLIQQLREELRELRKEKNREVQPQHPEQGLPTSG